MRKFKTFYIDFISKPLRSSIPFILLAIGLIAYVVSFFMETGNFQKVIFDFAELMIVAFFVSLVTNTYMFINIFRKNMEEIVSDYKYLENRKDIYSIWCKASKVLFSSKFPEISDELLSIVNTSYFWKNESKYYSDYCYSVSIEWGDKKKNHIDIHQELTYKLHCDSTDTTTVKSRTWTKIDPKREDSNRIQYSNCIINNVDAKIVNQEEYVDPATEDMVREQTIEVSGHTTYTVLKEIKKSIDIDLDPYLGFRPNYILRDLRVQVFKPKDLCITFVPRGTANDFTKIKKNEKYLEFQYNGLLLPMQGFILILQRK